MPRHSYDDLLRSLTRGEVVGAYYLYGTEDVLKDEAGTAILDRVLPPSDRAFNLEQRSAPSLDPEELHGLLNALPMLGERRLVWIKDIEALKKKATIRNVLLKYLGNPATETTLILQQGKDAGDFDTELGKLAYAVDFTALPPDRVTRWIAYQAGKLSLGFEPGAAEHLAGAVHYDLAVLRSELEKLAGLSDNSALSIERIEELIGVRHGETVQDWRDAVLDGNLARATSLLRTVLDQSGVSGVKLVTTLGTTLIGLTIARSHYERKLRGPALERAIFESIKRIRVYGLGDWKEEARKWSRWAERWTAARLRAATRLTLDADRALKGTRISDELGVMMDLVLQLADKRSEKQLAAAVQSVSPTVRGTE